MGNPLDGKGLNVNAIFCKWNKQKTLTPRDLNGYNIELAELVYSIEPTCSQYNFIRILAFDE